ncbi:MAG: NAD-dependent epimerase/dehydratase family protein [Deltaproteobacteria bacterium]|nr:NAD-dependent epimerase/dehydratase family protein [Deltaproteobacteria bacterium]
MNILIIGGTGFVGLELSKHLEDAGHNITLFHRNHAEGLPFKQTLGDCYSADELRVSIGNAEPDCVIHTTAMNKRHIAALEKALPTATRAVIISSADVYKAFEVFNRLSDAPIQNVPLDKTSPLRDVRHFCRFNDDEYEKIDVETAALGSQVIEPIILRLGMIFGANDPNRRFHDRIGAAQDGCIALSADAATWKTCYCGVKNAALGIALAADKGRAGEIYNLADKDAFTESEWYVKIAGLLNHNPEIILID